MMRQLIIHEPADPLSFLVQKLKAPDGKFKFLQFPTYIS